MNITETQTKHTSTKTLTVRQFVFIVSQGRTVGAGEILSIDGRVITVASIVEAYIAADQAAPTFVGEELELAEYTISRGICAWT